MGALTSCVVCKGPLTGKQEKYCSQFCSNKGRRRKIAGLPYRIECESCGTALSGRYEISRRKCLKCNPKHIPDSSLVPLKHEKCVVCDDPVTGRRLKYCSDKCQRIANKPDFDPETYIPPEKNKRCLVCDKPVFDPEGRGRRRTYCGASCRTVARRRRNANQPTKITCKMCGSLVTSQREVRKKLCLNCQPENIIILDEGKYKAGHKYDGKLVYRYFYTMEDALRFTKSEGFFCRHCGDEVSQEKQVCNTCRQKAIENTIEKQTFYRRSKGLIIKKNFDDLYRTQTKCFFCHKKADRAELTPSLINPNGMYISTNTVLSCRECKR